jgi:hypothetical protein
MFKDKQRFHDVEALAIEGDTLFLMVDGKKISADLRKLSRRLLEASEKQRNNYVVSPSGHGIHWPEIDEDIAIDPLLDTVCLPDTPSGSDPA